MAFYKRLCCSWLATVSHHSHVWQSRLRLSRLSCLSIESNEMSDRVLLSCTDPHEGKYEYCSGLLMLLCTVCLKGGGAPRLRPLHTAYPIRMKLLLAVQTRSIHSRNGKLINERSILDTTKQQTGEKHPTGNNDGDKHTLFRDIW